MRGEVFSSSRLASATPQSYIIIDDGLDGDGDVGKWPPADGRDKKIRGHLWKIRLQT